MISSPKPTLFIEDGGRAYYLRERLSGENLCGDEFLSNPELLVDLLVKAIKSLHSTAVSNRKYVIDEGYDTLIHGDFCLPNILACDGEVSGYIDLGDSGIGDPWRDYAWCIWSLRYNLKTDAYTELLLEKLGIEFDSERFERYTK
jgi:aminoglycoside phosphotransferase